MKFFKTPKKSLGQNFLIDQNIINKIINIAEINNKTILEIGPGYGSLTKKILAQNPKKIYAIEKDKNLSMYLENFFINFKKIKIINEDVLDIINNENFGNNLIIFGNLPYNISTQIVVSLIRTKKWPPWYNNLIFMFQKEVAERITAKDGSKNFGRLSIICNWRLDIKKHFNVSKNCFVPKPKIDSTILSFQPKRVKYNLKKPENLEMITRVLFSHRRKKIKKNFIKLFGNKSFADELSLNLDKRPEQLSSEMYYKITMKYEELFG